MSLTVTRDPIIKRPRPRRLALLWAAPLWAHLAALALVLLGLSAVIGTSSSFSADEGAAILQARSLSAGRGWVVADPVPEADATGVNYPLELSETGTRGSAPFGKHPLYALLLAGADHLGGVTTMVLLSLAGTVAAAGLAGALARRLDALLTRPTIWVVGVASPLLFDGFVLIAHTLGAALAAAAVLVAVIAVERRRPVRALAVEPLLVACVLLRTEAVFLAGALAVVAAAVAVWRRESRVVAGTVAIGALLAGGGGHFVERWWTAHLLGGRVAATVAGTTSTGSSGLVAGRIQGFLVTWLTPGYGGHPVTSAALLAMIAAIVLGAATIRWHPGDTPRIVGCAAVAAAAAVTAVVTGPTTVVPGLLLAFPLVVAGVLLDGRATFRTDAARILAAVTVLFALGVLATQYAKGGGGEWGGRYFALAIPLYVPVLLLALWGQRGRLAPAAGRWAMVALVVCSVALSTMGVAALRSTHQATARLVAAVDRAGSAVAEDKPVMVTTEGSMPRFAWSTFERQRWLLSTPDGLGDLLGRLRAAGISRIGFVSRDMARDQPRLEEAGVRVVSVDASQSDRRWEILVLQIP